LFVFDIYFPFGERLIKSRLLTVLKRLRGKKKEENTIKMEKQLKSFRELGLVREEG